MKTQPRLNSRMDKPENQIKMTDGNHNRKIPRCLLERTEFKFGNEDRSKSPHSEIWPFLSSGGQVLMDDG